jgi:hypothetical protein
MNEPFCADVSLAVGEPLAGTAIANTDRFIVLEHDAAWGPKGLDDSGLPESLVTFLGALSRRYPRLRVQLSRVDASRGRKAARTDGAGEGGVIARPRVYFADTGERPALHVVELERLEALTELPLEAWLRDEVPAPGAALHEPLYLVCVHGKRDRCCALRGVPVYRALLERVGERAQQTTHLGGHRFAATLLTLPAGLCYGRVEPSEAEALVSATERNRLHDLARLRGRTAYPSEAQAAEVVLRQQLGALQGDALVLLQVERTPGAPIKVRFEARDSGQQHEVLLTRESLPPAPQSCGAEAKAAQRLVTLAGA